MTPRTVVWRLIDTGPRSGVENMAIDEALLHHFDPDTSQPILRLYGWKPAALSLGRFQKAAEELNLERINALQLPVVRRITGGGAIYHAEELTYSIICSPQQIPQASSIKDSFRVLTSFLLGFYRCLGLDAGYALDSARNGERLGARAAFCFAGKENYDILINGRKIGGNAQRRLKNVVFQHGSIPLQDHVDTGLTYLIDKPQGLAEVVTCLACEGVAVELSALNSLLVDCFRLQMGGALSADSLSAAELLHAGKLVRDKYSNKKWNFEGELL